MTEWDYVVIGAGSSGCAVARELSASGDKRVLLLEAGCSNRSWIFKVPIASILQMPRFDWGYQSTPDPSRNQKIENWTRGRVVGGSSSINGMNYVRGCASDFDRWAVMGNVGWDAKSVMPLFRDLEHCDSSIPDSEIRGRNGPLHVRRVTHAHPATEAFINAAQAAGYRFTSDYNGASQEGIGYGQLTQRGRRRWSSADAFLTSALALRNFELIVNAQVHRLLIHERRVVGVRYEREGRLHEVRASQVILCAGAINTPQLLMLSGVGNAVTLAEQGIPIVLDRKAVGDNLMEHPVTRVTYRVRFPTYNVTGGVLQNLKLVARYVTKGSGPIAGVFESIAFLKTREDEQVPDVQLHIAALGFDDVSEGGRSLVQTLPFPSLSVIVNKNHTLSRGRITLDSADPKVAPRIEPNLLGRQEDVDTLVRGISVVRRIAAAPPLSSWITEEIRPGVECVKPEDLEVYVRNFASISYHPAGTCRMGADDEAIVTPDLKVRGLENLWIADASVMPDIISGNLNALCMVIGMKLGRYLAQRRH
jgi:choline dehydrogenase-like flavoprotein